MQCAREGRRQSDCPLAWPLATCVIFSLNCLTCKEDAVKIFQVKDFITKHGSTSFIITDTPTINERLQNI